MGWTWGPGLKQYQPTIADIKRLYYELLNTNSEGVVSCGRLTVNRMAGSVEFGIELADLSVFVEGD
jgi:hypothetical protein